MYCVLVRRYTNSFFKI